MNLIARRVRRLTLSVDVEFLGVMDQTLGSAGFQPDELNAATAVRAARSVYASLRQPQTLHGNAADQV